MKATLTIDLRPFTVPNFAIILPSSRTPAGEEERSIPLAALDADTLDKLCDEFRRNVFDKAGKTQPVKNVMVRP